MSRSTTHSVCTRNALNEKTFHSSNLIGCGDNNKLHTLYCDTNENSNDWIIPSHEYCGLLCVKENLEKGENFAFPKNINQCFSEAVAPELQALLEELRNTLHSTQKKHTTEDNIEKHENIATEKNIDNESSEVESDSEKRRIVEMSCSVTYNENSDRSLSLLLRFEDKMNRQLSCKVAKTETALDLANELVEYGLINKLDLEKVSLKISEHLEKS